MVIRAHIHKNTFRDSVYLMRLSNLVRGLEGVEGAEVIVGTDHNKKFLQAGGLMTPDIEAEASANDLIIVVRARDDAAAQAALDRAVEELHRAADRDVAAGRYVPRTFETALKQLPGANLALLSIPGRFVQREAERILEAGLHLMIFSDNVSLEAEVALKEKGLQKGLLVMGPDCGTAIINGVPLAFANRVRRGSIGVVAAAGTGLQEVTSLIHNMGGGISQGIGTGGRDIKRAVGGRMMLFGMQALLADPATAVVVLVSKPPDPEVAERVFEAASKGGKPVVTCFLGGDPEESRSRGLEPARTLQEAARKAVALVTGREPASESGPAADMKEVIAAEKRKLKEEQRFLRGLFSGGTLAYETMILLRETLGGIYSNVSLDREFALADVYRSTGHTVIDFGEDEFTQGRLHPMIDPALRNRRLVTEAGDPETAVIALDLVLGCGAHPDPAGAALEAVREARLAAAREGRYLPVVVSVCGTGDDPQNRAEQVAKLEAEGVLVLPSNAQAAMAVGELLAGRRRD